MALHRHADWPERMFDFFEAKRQQEFKWGENDCAGFVIDGIEAMTGERVAESFRSYRSASGAKKKIRDNGGMSGILEALGLQSVPVSFAQRGDIVVADMEGRKIYGLVAGNGFYCSPGDFGMMSRPMSEAEAVYRF